MTDLDPRLQAFLAGRYTIERELGRGGMATVYLVFDLRHERYVALKVLRPELAAAMGPERFLREIKIISQLDHPHILPLFDSGQTPPEVGKDPLLYYVMPYIEGESLRDRLNREPQLRVEDAVPIAREVADALGYAHSRNVLHRDIKPENILLSDGHARVTDFGIARAISLAGGDTLTQAGLAVGTPAYMSPEQSAAESTLDGRSDVYSLGCVLYEMLAGHPPFSGRTAQAVMARHSVDAVPPLRSVRAAIPEPLERAVLTALAKSPADRFATASAFSQALSGGAMPAAPGRTRFSLRPRHVVAAVAAGLLVALGFCQLRGRPGAAGPTDDLVAVLPFRVEGASPDLAWLREGMLDLLAIKLTGEGGLRAANPRSVLSAFTRVAGTGNDRSAETALDVARLLGAGRVIDGGIVGTPAHLTITAFLSIAPDGGNSARASVEGPVDSLSAMVDRLSAQLLSLEGGVDVSRLSSITTTSLPAIRTFLAGRELFRRGDIGGSLQKFIEASHLDSTFALAALEILHAAVWIDAGDEYGRAGRLALAGRDRLSPSDRTLLDIWTGPFPTGPELIDRWRRATAAYPDRAETWYGLGDTFFHFGNLTGLDHALDSAALAFRRGWAIDSASAADPIAFGNSLILAEPLAHMLVIAQVTGDTASVRQWASLALATESVGKTDWNSRWHLAMIEGDSARAAFWADSLALSARSLETIASFISVFGIGLDDYGRVHRLLLARASPRMAAEVAPVLALNGGRPKEALRLQTMQDDSARFFPERVGEALFWGGDPEAGADGARTWMRIMRETTAKDFWAPGWIADHSVIAVWKAAHGDLTYLDSTIRLLHQPFPYAGIPSDSIVVAHSLTFHLAMLEAMRSTWRHLPDARRRLEEADLAARTHMTFVGPGYNLLVAQLAEAQGDLPLALRAIRRRAGGTELGAPVFLSSFLHEEGRLAALTGDRAGAIRAYQHYLALRPNPENSVKPEVDQVRAELARLVGEQPRR